VLREKDLKVRPRGRSGVKRGTRVASISAEDLRKWRATLTTTPPPPDWKLRPPPPKPATLPPALAPRTVTKFGPSIPGLAGTTPEKKNTLREVTLESTFREDDRAEESNLVIDSRERSEEGKPDSGPPAADIDSNFHPVEEHERENSRLESINDEDTSANRSPEVTDEIDGSGRESIVRAERSRHAQSTVDPHYVRGLPKLVRSPTSDAGSTSTKVRPRGSKGKRSHYSAVRYAPPTPYRQDFKYVGVVHDEPAGGKKPFDVYYVYDGQRRYPNLPAAPPGRPLKLSKPEIITVPVTASYKWFVKDKENAADDDRRPRMVGSRYPPLSGYYPPLPSPQSFLYHPPPAKEEKKVKERALPPRQSSHDEAKRTAAATFVDVEEHQSFPGREGEGMGAHEGRN